MNRIRDMRKNQHAGFTLIELMIAVTLGLLVLAALTSFFVRTSYNRSELERNSRQIENGRYAISAIRDDMMVAGFYADIYQPGSTVWNTPAGCETTVANMGFVPNQLAPQLPVPIFIYPLGAGRPTACTPDYLAGTDVIVVRRFNTEPTAIGSVNASDVYVQVSECSSDPPATPYKIDIGTNAATALTLRQRNCTAIASPYRYREQLYYIRDYSVTAGDGLPTLVRVELSGGVSTYVPLVDGIENLRVDLGVDNDGNGSPDVWRRCDATTPCSAADYSNVMAAKVYIISRNIEQTREYTDDKTYDLGVSGTTTAAGDHYKRHVYSALIAMPNRSGPREPALAS